MQLTTFQGEIPSPSTNHLPAHLLPALSPQEERQSACLHGFVSSLVRSSAAVCPCCIPAQPARRKRASCRHSHCKLLPAQAVQTQLLNDSPSDFCSSTRLKTSLCRPAKCPRARGHRANLRRLADFGSQPRNLTTSKQAQRLFAGRYG